MGKLKVLRLKFPHPIINLVRLIIYRGKINHMCTMVDQGLVIDHVTGLGVSQMED
jgi:hypothetical protein